MDGYFFTVIADSDSPLDITPQANYNYYTYAVNFQKHVPVVSVNGINADDTTVPQLAVGQKAAFSLSFSPALPGASQTGFAWSFEGPCANSVKDLGNGQYSATYNPALLANSSPNIWWITATLTGAVKSVDLGLTLDFGNGYCASLSTAGKVRVFSPEIEGLLNWDFQKAQPIMEGNLLTVGNSMNGGMLFDIAIDNRATPFSFSVQLTQLVRREASYDRYWVPPYYVDSTSGHFWLDNSYPYGSYPGGPLNAGYERNFRYFDQPTYQGMRTYVSVDDEFKAYVQVIASDGEAIPITIGIVNWDWYGRGDYVGGQWVKSPTSYIHAPTFTNSSEFPTWPRVYQNP